MGKPKFSVHHLLLLLLGILQCFPFKDFMNATEIDVGEWSVEEIQEAFSRKDLTSTQLVDFYLKRIEALNPVLRAVLKVNPDAWDQAEKADREREVEDLDRSSLHGIPVLLKDSIGTKDKMNTTCG